MPENLYRQAIAFLSHHLNATANITEADRIYRYEHSLRVGTLAARIADAEQADVTVCALAGILHDVGIFDSPSREEHARISAAVARPFLETLALSEKQVGDVCYCIAAHYDGDASCAHPPIPEADIVSDADNIDRFDVWRVVETLQWWGAPELAREMLVEKLNERVGRHDELLQTAFSTPTSTRLFHENIEKQRRFYIELLEQLKTGDESFFDSLE